MSDYTLPPVPIACEGWSVPAQSELRSYGHACAEHVRAEITPRVVEILKERDRLRAEVEKLRAASVIEWEPGRSYTAAELLRRAIRGIRARKGRSICPAVENLFGCGNTVARYLCRWAGRDPDTGKAIAARKGEGSEG